MKAIPAGTDDVLGALPDSDIPPLHAHTYAHLSLLLWQPKNLFPLKSDQL